MKLTAQAVRKLLPDPERRREIKDDETPYLRLRIYPGGGKSFILRYKFKGKSRVLALGSALTLAEARKRAKEAQRLLTDKQNPRDPAAETQRQRSEALACPTVAEFVEEYLAKYVPPKSPGGVWRSKPEHERILRREVVPALGKLRIDEVDYRDVQALIDRIAERAPVMANRTKSVLSCLFTFARQRRVLPAQSQNPTTGIRKRTEGDRDRVLTDGEIRLLWQATEPQTSMEAPTRLALRLLLLTGQRAREVCEMERSELEPDLSRWTLPATRSKNGQAHSVPLAASARALIAEALEVSPSDRFVFGSMRKDGPLTASALLQAMRRLYPGPDYPHVHDLRRTVGTRLPALKVSREAMDKVLNHKDGSVGGRYDRYRYDNEKRAAFSLWERTLHGIVSGQAPAKVVSIR